MSRHAIAVYAFRVASEEHMWTTRPNILVILASLSTLIMVSCETLAEGLTNKHGLKLLTDNTINKFVPYKRHYKFYNHCSEKQIQVIGNSITALGLPESPNSRLILQPAHYDNHYGINIIGEKSGRFICFNKKSKLITRFSGANPRCIFEEQYSPDKMYSVLRSVYNHDWCIGFNKKGKPISGSNNKKFHRRQCYYFTKRDHNYLADLYKKPDHGPIISDPRMLAHHIPGFRPAPRFPSSKNFTGRSGTWTP